VRGGPLSDPKIIKMLQPFVVTAWHGANESAMPADVKEVFQKSAVAKDPKRFNVFIFILGPDGRLVHDFHGLPATARGANEGRSDYTKEIPTALAKLQLPAEKLDGRKGPRPVVLPDLKGTAGGAPAGARLFVRLNDAKDPFRSKLPVVEVMAMRAEDWKALALPEKAKEIEAAALKSWLVHLYPPGIRAADQKKPFTKITGTLKLEPAGADKQRRYALLRGEVKLAKGGEKESAFEGSLQAVLTYGFDMPEVKSVRAVGEGHYLYRELHGRGTQRMPMVVAIESRPE
jgi:hypothetical protein